MARKITIVTVCTVCCIIIIGFASFVKSCNNMGDYELQVKNIKKQIPIATQFIEENEEFLDVLLTVAEKLQGYVAELNIDEDITDTWLFEFYYSQEKKM